MNRLNEHEWQRLEALADEVIPADDFPSASELDFRQFMEQNWNDAVAPRIEQLKALLAGEPLEAHAWFVHLVAQGYYADPGNGGNYAGASFQMIGFKYAPDYEVPHELPFYESLELESLDSDYDVIVIGAGAGGGVVSRKLSEAGLEVLCVERGKYLNRADVPMDHLRNHRFPLYGHNVGPEIEGNPRTLITSGGRRLLLQPHQPGYGNNAMGVGGGTRVWGAQAWRFAPDDFRMASRYGVPKGSSLADWPIDYEALAPHYDWVEYALGVSGEEGHAHHGPRNKPFPMPPIQGNLSREILSSGAAKLAWNVRAAPLAINSVDYQGRSACVHAGLCIGFACPSNARGGSHNTMIPAAMKTGHFTLATEMQVTRIFKDGTARVRGIELVDKAGRRKKISGDRILVCAGAIESARLLLVSGMGTESDQLGRHLQGHLYTGAIADFDQPLANEPGPGVTVSTCQFSHGNQGIVGGGMIANDFPILPVQFWVTHQHRAPSPWGLANKKWMRHAYHHTHTVMGPTQEIPLPESRVQLDPEVTDRFGMPVVQLSGEMHPESIRTGRFMRDRAGEWLAASGGKNIETFGAETGAYVSAGQHQAGTCRMGKDSTTSVTNSRGLVHEFENLYVADASLHVTNGGFNPGLTVMALASLVADGILSE